MFGDKALELVKELKRAMEGTVPPYNVRYCLLLFIRKLAGKNTQNFLPFIETLK